MSAAPAPAAPPLPAGAWVRAGLAPGFRAEAVVLDVDGVLIDVRGSFREAARQTVVTVQRLLGVADPWRPSQQDIVDLKSARGFNDDIDVSIALAALGADGRQAELPGLRAAVDAIGGGLAGLRRVAPDLRRIDGTLVLRIFDELYWGADATERRGGEPARYGADRRGLIEREELLIAPALPERLRASGARAVAIVSGRTRLEMDAALDRLGWTASDLDAVVTGDAIRKPDPACLDCVVAATGVGSLVYVGDVRDDWELVRRYRNERAGAAEARGILVGATGDVSPMRALGVDATLERTEDLIALLSTWAHMDTQASSSPPG
ncbi:MAG TPA: HAD family hydrolase [Candidatus Dormibacteraeota bacterium]